MRIVITLLAALAGAYVFERLRVPAGSLLGAAVVVAAVNLMGDIDVPALPSSIRFVAFAVLGWMVGQSIDRDSLSELQSSLVVVAVSVGVLVVVGGLLALVLTRWGGVDQGTAYLATSPGALSQMVALSEEARADTLLVVTVHTARLVAVILVSPVITRLLT
jgi:membrane AbrB-like protein